MRGEMIGIRIMERGGGLKKYVHKGGRPWRGLGEASLHGGTRLYVRL